MYKLVYLELAIKDMTDIVTYISYNLQNKSSALQLSNLFVSEAKKILEFPYAYTEYISSRELKNNYRSIRIKNFIMFYTINENDKQVVIVRVLYRKRDMDNFLT